MKTTARPASMGRKIAANANVYDDGRLRVEHDNYYVACEGLSLKFPRTEFLLISRLTSNPDRVVPSQDLWRYAWGDGKPFKPDSLHVHIYRLRQRLEPYGIKIETMVNVGYRLVPATQNNEEGSNAAARELPHRVSQAL